MFKQRLSFILMSLVLAIGLFVLFDNGWLAQFDARLQDRLLMERVASPQIVIVAIDNESINEFGVWPWPRTLHAQMIDKLTAVGAKVIGYDVTFADPGPDALADLALVEALQAADKVILASEASIELRADQPPLVTEVIRPLEIFRRTFGPTTLIPDSDGIIRRVPLSFVMTANLIEPSFASQVYSFAFSGEKTDNALVILSPKLGFSNIYRIAYSGGPEHYTTYSFADVLQGRVLDEQLRDKIVLVGSTAPDLHDEFLTPFGGGEAMAGVEIQANVLQSLLEARALTTLDRAQAFTLLGLLTLVLISLGLSLPLRYLVVTSVSVLIAYLIVAVGSVNADVLMPIAVPLILIVGITLLDVLYRYKDEYARRQFIQTAFGRYVAPAVVEKLIKGETQLQLGGSKQELSILFSDIRGFTSLSEKLPAEKLVPFLNSYLSAMTGLVLESEGTVDKYIGDAVMAFWGAPIHQDDHAVRAVTTALKMRAALTDFNWKALKQGQPAIEIGIGINTGEVIVGNMGSDKRFDYTVIGDDVNLASRLESLTKYYGVGLLITKATKDKLGEKFLMRLIDVVAVKGRQQAVRIYEVIALSEESTIEQKQFVLDSYMALELYYDRKFTEAEVLFAKVGNKIFVERCQDFIANPPTADWVGVYVAKDK